MLSTVHRDRPHAKCLALEWLRAKTSTADTVALMPHASDFELCIVHTLASHAAMTSTPGKSLFPSFSTSNEWGKTRINQNMIAVEHYFGVDTSCYKPASYTSDITKHSLLKVLQRIEQKLDQHQTNTVPSTPQEAIPHQGRKRSRQMTISGFTVGAQESVAPRTDPLKHCVTLDSLYYNWFKDELYDIDTDGSIQLKSDLKKLSRMIMYLRLFIDSPCDTLQSKPSRDYSTAYSNWVMRLCTESQAVQL